MEQKSEKNTNDEPNERIRGYLQYSRPNFLLFVFIFFVFSLPSEIYIVTIKHQKNKTKNTKSENNLLLNKCKFVISRLFFLVCRKEMSER